MYFDIILFFSISFITLFCLRKVAKYVGLVDKPNSRKLHNGAIPLVGGIAIYFTFSSFILLNSSLLIDQTIYLLSISILVFIGVIDDRFDISYKFRFLIQSILSLVMMLLADIQLHTIGNVFGFGNLDFGVLGYFVTIIAVIGAINAFNMVDGIDGLLGGLSIVTFGALGLILYYAGQQNLSYLCLILIVIISPYVLMNLGYLGHKRKVFMGDAGSMFIGFTVIWFLLLSSQNGEKPPLRPVTALWLIALPLMDMAAIMIRRIRKGNSPFKPDREHLHHIIQRLGFKQNHTLIIICTVSVCFAAFGIYGEINLLPESFMFYSFIFCFILYHFGLSKVSTYSEFDLPKSAKSAKTGQ